MSKIEIRDLRKEFSTPHGTEVAVDGINITIDEEEFVTLVGPSGCGKTTTLRCLAGLETPTSGQIRLNGTDITDIPPNKRNIAMMFQSIALYPHMTVRDNIGYPLKVHHVPEPDRQQPVEDIAGTMQIQDMLDKYPGDLSGGQQQRAALARTVVQEPEAFLMDEPLSDLDAKLKVEIRKEIQRIHKKVKKPFVYVTHDQEEAMTMSDRVAVLNDGRVEQISTPDRLFRYPENLFVGQFIGNYGMNTLQAELLEFGEGTVSVGVDGNTAEMEFDKVHTEPSENEVQLGFRPERTRLNQTTGGDPIITGTVSLLESFGEQTVATVDTAQGPLDAVIPSDQDINEGESVSVSFDRTRAHLFAQSAGDIVVHSV